MSVVHHGPPVYINADKTAIVDQGSPDAAFLLVGTNSRVPGPFLALYREHFDVSAEDGAETPKPRVVSYGGDPEPAPDVVEEAEPEPAPEPAATTKPRKRSTRKAAAKSKTE